MDINYKPLFVIFLLFPLFLFSQHLKQEKDCKTAFNKYMECINNNPKAKEACRAYFDSCQAEIHHVCDSLVKDKASKFKIIPFDEQKYLCKVEFQKKEEAQKALRKKIKQELQEGVQAAIKKIKEQKKKEQKSNVKK